MVYLTGTALELGTALLRDLGHYRYRVFVERLGWKLPDARDGTEWDRFDTPQTVHVVALDAQGRIQGCARLLPTTGPYLLADVFPELMGRQPCPRADHVWELSRFAAIDLASAPASGHTLGSPAALALLRRAMQDARHHGARELVSVSPVAIERILRRGGFAYAHLGAPMDIDGQHLFACSLALSAPRSDRLPVREGVAANGQVRG
ncbi:MAG: GNAT family N-acetyltransferase [Pseudacidovorax sp.]|uniref:acyl-homoserine-lactone synthase n=1 Tax=Pseudacidovorax sp. TaxID=1934311 RepID=UPI001B4636F0|nr:acyl-homoserine-lactone synthase [Pseudacidovorax sp.]MBP6892900.1 GNAT family N-acetyltransferase [Pseudacidovorax sp.]